MREGGKALSIVLLAILHVFFFLGRSQAAGSTSENYAISTSVFSGGGESMGSANFNATGTIGQPSPLMDPADPPYSTNYDLYPGFWYTLEAAAECGDLASFAAAFGHVNGEPGYNSSCDSEPDDDVDGLDLAEYAGSL